MPFAIFAFAAIDIAVGTQGFVFAGMQPDETALPIAWGSGVPWLRNTVSLPSLNR